MSKNRTYAIDFTHIKKEVETVEYHLEDAFFEHIEGSEITGGDVHLVVTITPMPNRLYDLTFDYSGVVTLPCDRCLAPMQLPMEVHEMVTVELGEALDDEDDEHIVLNELDPTYDFGWIAYELLALHLPIQHTHEPIEECDQEMVKYLVDRVPEEGDQDATTQPDNSVWDDLRSKIENKQ